MVATRDELIQQHIIHDFDATIAFNNLRGCYGKVTQWYYERLLRHVVGNRVLDAGCGFGLFSHLCSVRGFQVHAIDIDDASLAIARSLYGIDCHNESVYHTSLSENSIDTVVLNDVVCHLDIPEVLAEVKRLGAHRIIVLDSNILNPLLRAYRRSVGHEEHHDYKPADLAHSFREGGFAPVEVSFGNFLCLPVSGGLQRRPIPILGRFPRLVFLADRVLGGAFKLVRLDKWFAFRFTAIFDQRSRT